jgi:putative SOS response-associated peptidase YedK
MCGRFHRFDDVQKMATQFRVKYDESLFAPPTYNAPPQTWQPVIRLDQDGEREIVNMRWGLVPYWILLANSISLRLSGVSGIRTPDPLLPKQIRNF